MDSDIVNGTMDKVDIDKLPTKESLIDLGSYQEGDFGLDDFIFCKVLDDVLLVKYVDELSGNGGDGILRGGIYIPTNTLSKAWRKARVILAGPNVKFAVEGDIVVFPHNMGVTVANLEVDGHGKLDKCVFLNEQRIFGICKYREDK